LKKKEPSCFAGGLFFSVILKIKEENKMNDRVKQTLTAILDKFKSGDIPQVVAVAMFPISNIPCSKWSLLNRVATNE
jgi:hypothetical protein